MGSLHDAVMQYVECELKKDPGVKNATLLGGACDIDESIGKLTPRQFHGKYRLPATRRIAPQRRRARQSNAPSEPEAPPGRETAAADAPGAAGDPAAVRRLLLDLATELANAGSQAETIEVMVRLDDYVADIMKAAQG